MRSNQAEKAASLTEAYHSLQESEGLSFLPRFPAQYCPLVLSPSVCQAQQPQQLHNGSHQ